jgi:poly(hydroxyalkanoate) depolymerase family esterase
VLLLAACGAPAERNKSDPQAPVSSHSADATVVTTPSAPTSTNIPPPASNPTAGPSGGTGPVSAAIDFQEITGFGSNPAGLKMYLHAPAAMPATAPVVVALHGCAQSAKDYVAAGWNEIADRWKFYVVYAEQQPANNGMTCFRWYDPAQTKRGGGEVESVKQMVDVMRSRYGATHAFVTGLSAGAAMTAALLATYPDVFEGGAIMAGIPYKCAASSLDAYTCMNPGKDKTQADWAALAKAGNAAFSGQAPRVSVWHGTADFTVKDTNAEELVRQWTGAAGIDDQADATSTVSGATHTEYKDAAGTVRVERWSVPGMGHGTAIAPADGCGDAAPFILDVKICSSEWAARFFGLEP